MRRSACQGSYSTIDYSSVSSNEDNPMKIQEFNCEIDNDDSTEKSTPEQQADTW